jgi:sugar phosphate isomerase/epimerase
MKALLLEDVMDKMLGVMIDCSRNAVMNVKTIKRVAEYIKRMGYNTIFLYTEDTYEVHNQPYFGHLRGRYSKEELKEIDRYCVSLGIELIPCIQTLAHLETMFKWVGVYDEVNDCDNILLVGEEKTYKLIEDMISTVSQCFSTKKIHLGMDEAFRVGTGKYQSKNGIRCRFDILNEHLSKVCDIANKYDMEPIIFGDMFYKNAFNIENLDVVGPEDIPTDTEVLKNIKIPDNISFVTWDYYSDDYEHYKSLLKISKLFGKKVYFFAAGWTINSFSPDNEWSMISTEAAFKACADVGVDGLVMSMWGDNGGECSRFAVLPALMYAAEAAKGNYDLKKIKLLVDNLVLVNKIISSEYLRYNTFSLLKYSSISLI